MHRDYFEDFPIEKPNGEEAFKFLIRGNQRYADHQMNHPHQDSTRLRHTRFADQKEHAFAVIVGCSDSRVPPELIFDRGIMDLFVVRTAGNVIDTHEIASIEYALKYLEIELLVILGHKDCGAVKTALSFAETPDLELSPSIKALVSKILPEPKEGEDPPDLEQVIQQNVFRSYETLLERSEICRELIEKGKVLPKLGVFHIQKSLVDWM